jgi:hypothetical protein
MVKEAGVKTYLHSWGTMPIMEGNKVRERSAKNHRYLGKTVVKSHPKIQRS